MGKQNPTSIKELFQGLIPDQGGIIQGRVTSVSPLQIRAINDDKLTIGAVLLIVPKHLTDYKATADFAVPGGTYTGTITIHNGLKAGEKVHLLSLNNGKKYYILDRVV